MHSAASELVSQGYHAICFMGGFPRAPIYRDAADNPRLPIAVDAWVLLSSTMRCALGELKGLVHDARPCVSVGLELPGTPSFTASDEAGIFQAVAHLARRHQRRRIAFVAGPSTSVEAPRRLEGYRMALESVGLPADPALIAAGDYHGRSGREAVGVLLRQARKFDAVVAANDLMAIGVIEGLRASGLSVPQDVSVVGFDDIEEASFSAPTLTTVRQPLQEVGAAAAAMAIKCLEGMSVEPHTKVTAPLVIRQSCGCSDSDVPERRLPATSEHPAATQALRETALRDLVRREFASSRLQRELSRLGESLLGASDYPEMAPILGAACRLLSVKRLLLATYSSSKRHARITLESGGDSVVFNPHAEAHGIDQLLPPSFLRSDRPMQVAVHALELAGEQMGYFMLDGDMRDAHAYLDLKRSLSGGLARMSQSRELRRVYTAEKKRT
ncbi:MAG TPA: substrate-binding domain-containing protein [Polyangiaceae bacterium]|nr:substrate-binding domain-containing protein [Polyangiaceae bacterium]